MYKFALLAALVAVVSCAPEPRLRFMDLEPKVITKTFDDCDDFTVKEIVPKVIEPLPVMEFEPEFRHVEYHHELPLVKTLVEKPKIIEKTAIRSGAPSYSYSISNVNVHNPSVMEVEKTIVPGTELRMVHAPAKVLKTESIYRTHMPVLRAPLTPIIRENYIKTLPHVISGVHPLRTGLPYFNGLDC